jgi:hypothetical protein
MKSIRNGNSGVADTLPMLPESWPLVVYDKTKDQFEVVRKILYHRAFRRSSARRTRARGRTDLPLHLRSGELSQALPATMDLFTHAQQYVTEPGRSAKSYHDQV